MPPLLEMLAPVPAFRTVFPISSAALTEMPPPLLPLSVLCVMVPPPSIPPPDKIALLPLTVLLVSVTLPEIPPPRPNGWPSCWPGAELPLIVLFVMVPPPAIPPPAR